MHSETGLIASITIALAVAFCGGFIATKLRLPAVVGYLLSGIAIGPYTPGFVGDVEAATQLADLGIILLMFGVGIHFSLSDLLAVRRIVIVGALCQILIAGGMGFGLAQIWGLSTAAGLVLGLSLSIASTVVVLHFLEEHNLLDTTHGRISVGWLIVEDLFTVLALVLLPTVVLVLDIGASAESSEAPSGSDVVVTIAITLGKVALFATTMYYAGSKIVPWLLVQVAYTGSRELFTLSVLALALGIALVSSNVFGVSIALGAFLAGLVVSESDISHHAAANALPFRDAFAVLFFASVGMLFDPYFILSYPVHTALALGIVVLVRPLIAGLVLSLMGYPVRTTLTVAAGRAQIGEFSFIMIGLGSSLGVFPDEGGQLVLTVALLSITFQPFIFRLADPLESWLRGHPSILGIVERAPEKLDELPPSTSRSSLRGHAVLCGYGRVGSLIADALSRRGFTYVVVDQDRRLVEDLRRVGMPVVYGNAANRVLLDNLNLRQARVLVVAIPDPIETRLVVDYARETNPGLDIVVRTPTVVERQFLQARGVNEAVVGEVELALEMTRHTLHRFGLSVLEVQTILQGLRARYVRED